EAHARVYRRGDELDPAKEAHKEARRDHLARRNARGWCFNLLQRASVYGRKERNRNSQLPSTWDTRKDPHRQGAHNLQGQAHESEGRSETVRLLLSQRKVCSPERPEGDRRVS